MKPPGEQIRQAASSGEHSIPALRVMVRSPPCPDTFFGSCVHRSTSGPSCPSWLLFLCGLGSSLPSPQSQCQARPSAHPHTCRAPSCPCIGCTNRAVESHRCGSSQSCDFGQVIFSCLCLSIFSILKRMRITRESTLQAWGRNSVSTIM